MDNQTPPADSTTNNICDHVSSMQDFYLKGKRGNMDRYAIPVVDVSKSLHVNTADAFPSGATMLKCDKCGDFFNFQK